MLRTKRSDYSAVVSADSDDDRNDILLLSDSSRQQRIRHEQTLEAEVLVGDTISSISLRFGCSVQDIKRLNKIDRENEIYAFHHIKVPLTAQNILLDTIPKVHKSGQNSPNNKLKVSTSLQVVDDATQKEKLEEKLLVAAVSSAVISRPKDAAEEETTSAIEDTLVDRAQFRGYPRQITARNDYLTFSGSDCELNWIVLLICILAVCVIVPLIIFYMIEIHPEKFTHHVHSKYDDTDKHQLHHLNDQHFSSTYDS